MRIRKYSDFVSLKESQQDTIKPSGAAMIGDSITSCFIQLMPELITYNNNKTGGLSKGGWHSYQLYSALQAYTKTHPEIKVLFVKIGDNDLYKKNLAEKYAPLIKTELTRIFPNAKYVMVKGGWGWGGLDIFKSTEEPKELIEYYDVWNNLGFELTQNSHGYSQKHHDASNPNIKKQVEELRQIISNTPDSTGGLLATINKDVDNVVDHLNTIENITGFYDLLTKSIQDNITYNQQGPRSYKYSNVVRGIQIGLDFLGFKLPKYGSDGLYGSETENSMSQFKSKYGSQTPSGTFTPDDLTKLIGALKEKNFGESQLQGVWTKSYDLADEKLVDFASVGGDNEFLYYMPHQQGKAGCLAILKAYLGKGRIHPVQRRNSGEALVGNTGSDEKQLHSDIRDAINRDDDQKAAELFLTYQKQLWQTKIANALSHINLPKNAEVKQAIDEVPTLLPKAFLYKVAFIESSYNPLASINKPSKNFKGLYALKPEWHANWVRDNLPGQKPNVYDVKQNALHGIRNLEAGIKFLNTNLSPEEKSALGMTNIPNA